MNRKIVIGVAVAIVLVVLWMWWSKRSKKAQVERPSDDKPTPLAVDALPEETDVTWTAQEIAEEKPAIKEE